MLEMKMLQNWLKLYLFARVKRRVRKGNDPFIHRNGDGFIDREEFGEILHLTGEPVTEEDIDEMFVESDLNKDGKVDFDGKIKYVQYPQLFSTRKV